MKEGDGVRLNGTEYMGDRAMQTYEVWVDGSKAVGPSPQGNFWTRAEAIAFIEDVENQT